MQLGTRLLLVGAVLPATLLLAALVVGGVALDRILHREIDRALLGQAAVEAVSLFDRADAPHLHLVESPLDARVREFAPLGALYGPRGELIVRYPDGAGVPTSLDPDGLTGEAELDDADIDGTPRRVLRMQVRSPSGLPHGLWLAASLETHDSAVRVYWQFTSIAVAVVVLLLAAIQVAQARQLTRRVTALADHMQRLRAGELGSTPAPDAYGDVIQTLRDAVADTTLRLSAAREAQDRLLADAAHELRTPLTAMRAGIDVALRRHRDAAQLEEVLADQRGEVDRLTELATRLLDMAALRGAPLELAAGDLAELVHEAVDAARAVAEERGIMIELAEVPRAEAAFARSVLRQALDNLLDNAIKFSRDGGRVEVALDHVDTRWRIRVCDHGPGVPTEARERIFDAFERADRAVRGKGLGLAIVAEVARRHGGRCFVAERPDGGSGAVFVLELGPDGG